MGTKLICLLFTLMVVTSQIHGSDDSQVQTPRHFANGQAQGKQRETAGLSVGENPGFPGDIEKSWRLIMTFEVATTRLEKVQSELDEKITIIEQELMKDHEADLHSFPAALQPTPGEVVATTDYIQMTVVDQIVQPTVQYQEETFGMSGEQQEQEHQQQQQQQQQQQDSKQTKNEQSHGPQQDHAQQTQPPMLQGQQPQPSPPQQSPTQPQPSPTQPQPSQGNHHKQSQTSEAQQRPAQEPPPEEDQQTAARGELTELEDIIELASGLTHRHKARPTKHMLSSARSPPIWQDDRAEVPPVLQALARQGRLIEREGLPWLPIK